MPQEPGLYFVADAEYLR